MAQIHESKVSLRIAGDSLLPERITELLGAPPTFCHAKGHEIPGSRVGRSRIARSGIWLLCVDDQSPEDLDGQVRELLGQLTDDLEVWQRITDCFSADLIVGLFMRGSNEGLTMSARVVKMIAERGLEIGFDVYSADQVPEV